MALSSLSRGTLVNLGGRATVVGAGLLLTVVVARLGPQTQGALALFMACEAALLTLCSGFGLVLARVHSQGVCNGGPLHSSLLAAAGLASLGGAALLWTVSRLSEAAPYRHLWLLALAAPLLCVVPTVSGVWLGQRRLLRFNAFGAASPVAVLLLLAAALAAGLHHSVDRVAAGGVVLMVLAAWAVGKAGVGAVALAVAVREQGWQRPRPAVLEPWVGFVVLIGLSNLLSLLNYRVNLFMVERLVGLSQAGVYSVAVTVAELLWFLSSAVTTALYASIGGRDAPAAAASAVKAVRVGVASVVCAAPLLLAAAWWALPVALGEAYHAAWWPLVLLVPGTLAYSAASGVSAYFTNQLAKPQWAGGIALLSMLVNVGLSLWWIPRWGIAGAAAATSVSYGLAIAVGLSLFLNRSRLPWRVLWGGAAQSPP